MDNNEEEYGFYHMKPEQKEDVRPDAGPETGAAASAEAEKAAETTEPSPEGEPPRYSSVEYGYTPDSSAARRKKRGNRIVALTVALCLVLAAACGLGGVLLGRSMFSSDPVVDPGKEKESEKEQGNTSANVVIRQYAGELEPGSTADVAKECGATVVEIVTESVEYSSYFNNRVTSGAGSGVIIAEDTEKELTYIVTNNHVIEGCNSIRVKCNGASSYKDAKVVGTDWISDVAVICIEGTGYKCATLGVSGDLEWAQDIVVIGNPLGSLGGSVARGVIAGLSRNVTVDGITHTLIQLDASINPGNSGGGLFNMAGQLVGIVNAKSTGEYVDGIGFAIPIDTAADVAGQIINKGYVSGRPDLGFTFGTSTTNEGLTVYSYDFNGDAGLSTKIENGHILYSVNGTVISSMTVYRGALSKLKAGDTVEAVMYRPIRHGFMVDYQEYKVTLTVHEYVPEIVGGEIVFGK